MTCKMLDGSHLHDSFGGAFYFYHHTLVTLVMMLKLVFSGSYETRYEVYQAGMDIAHVCLIR